MWWTGPGVDEEEGHGGRRGRLLSWRGARSRSLGHGRTKLDDEQKEVRGSFAVRVFGAFGQPELEVTRMWGGVVHPFTCTYRGYRKLTGDFQGMCLRRVTWRVVCHVACCVSRGVLCVTWRVVCHVACCVFISERDRKLRGAAAPSAPDATLHASANRTAGRCGQTGTLCGWERECGVDPVRVG